MDARCMDLGNRLKKVTMPMCPPRSKAMPMPMTVIQTKRLMVISSVAAREKWKMYRLRTLRKAISTMVAMQMATSQWSMRKPNNNFFTSLLRDQGFWAKPREGTCPGNALSGAGGIF